MKNQFKVLLSTLLMGLFIVGCSDDDDPASSDSCTTHLMAYSENIAGMLDGTMTQAQRETANTALQDWCADSCEPADTAADDVMCTDDVAAWTAEDITAACELLIGGGSAASFTAGTYTATDWLSPSLVTAFRRICYF